MLARAVWEPNTLDKLLRPASKETERLRVSAAAKRAVAAGAAMFD